MIWLWIGSVAGLIALALVLWVAIAIWRMTRAHETLVATVQQIERHLARMERSE